ncbi:phosphoribosylaminoimidazolesuccinocarboxamide synthase [Salipaludibacillus keqinensis]|uniref:Phosphoribosylaminoimidazole-succinocarboxamide synthase n=1 Tax=Salipaludibacillus keqinensis TaxID=2045207 RepID=A0A323TBE6_9BACI|nr:phosphoribosylaminoimidazolesuccinocarboxamide synthase [Salipaludibacillus keqinensis]PYZ92230.1 phosphoribosylaminoimidazolesuccinocarboxamide synthase [Salipaludibacillus keqinensis]
MEKKGCLYEGKAKRIYETEKPEVLWVEYKDDATAFNGEKKETLLGKGRLNNEISSLIFSTLAKQGVKSHFIERLSETEQLIRRVTIIPIEVVVRNVAAGSLVKRLGFTRGETFHKPIVELYYKDDELGDPLMNEEHIQALQLATPDEIQTMKEKALAVNEQLIELFKRIDVQLIDFKLEFGRDTSGNVLLADEISPDTCRLWDIKTGESFDKDLFRFQQGNLQEGYETIFNRLGGQA